MRLIEVADLEKFIQENVCVIGDDHILLVAGNDGRWQEALPLIKTAYDVDKVVEELEERKALHERLVDYEAKNGTVTEKYQHIKAIDVLNDAIGIVKQGGISDDVCKWEYDGDNLITSCGDYFNLYDNCTEKFKYCPVCGKKIKVVE